MSREPLDCSTVTDRLIEGERSGQSGDPELAQHVGSCLTCFRTANDLKGLPQLRRQLLQSESATPASDPGTAFWAAFPAQVSAAWEASRAAAAAAAVAPVSPSWRERMGQRLDAAWAWLRLPVPAALGGALCAAAIIVAVARPWTGRPGTAAAPLATVSAAAGVAQGQESIGVGLGGLVPGGSMDDSLKELDVTGLWALHSGIEQTLNDDVRKRAPSDSEEPADSNPTALSDDLEELSDTGLSLLSQNLEGT